MLTSSSHPLPFNTFQILLLSSVKHHMVVKRLAQAGHTCDVVHDVKEGLQLVSAHHHQVINNAVCSCMYAHVVMQIKKLT